MNCICLGISCCRLFNWSKKRGKSETYSAVMHFDKTRKWSNVLFLLYESCFSKYFSLCSFPVTEFSILTLDMFGRG